MVWSACHTNSFPDWHILDIRSRIASTSEQGLVHGQHDSGLIPPVGVLDVCLHSCLKVTRVAREIPPLKKAPYNRRWVLIYKAGFASNLLELLVKYDRPPV